MTYRFEMLESTKKLSLKAIYWVYRHKINQNMNLNNGQKGISQVEQSVAI